MWVSWRCVSRVLNVWFTVPGVVILKVVKFGFLDNAIVDTHEVEFRKINANGNDFIYVSKNSVNVNADDDDGRHTNPPSEFIPVNEDSRNSTI